MQDISVVEVQNIKLFQLILLMLQPLFAQLENSVLYKQPLLKIARLELTLPQLGLQQLEIDTLVQLDISATQLDSLIMNLTNVLLGVIVLKEQVLPQELLAQLEAIVL